MYVTTFTTSSALQMFFFYDTAHPERPSGQLVGAEFESIRAEPSCRRGFYQTAIFCTDIIILRPKSFGWPGKG